MKTVELKKEEIIILSDLVEITTKKDCWKKRYIKKCEAILKKLSKAKES